MAIKRNPIQPDPPPVRAAKEAKQREAERRERIKHLPARRAFKPFEITDERLDMHTAAIAHYDPRNYFDSDGRPIPINELSDEAAYALAGLDVYEEWDRNGQDTAKTIAGLTKKYKLSDKLKAIEMLNKMRGRLNGGEDERNRDKLAELVKAIEDSPK